MNLTNLRYYARSIVVKVNQRVVTTSTGMAPATGMTAPANKRTWMSLCGAHVVETKPFIVYGGKPTQRGFTKEIGGFMVNQKKQELNERHIGWLYPYLPSKDEEICPRCQNHIDECTCHVKKGYIKNYQRGFKEGDGMKRVWKPLDVGGLRLYEVHQTFWHGATKLHTETHMVVDISPSKAAERIQKIYNGTEWVSDITSVSYIGKAINVLMPEAWWVEGIHSPYPEDKAKA